MAYAKEVIPDGPEGIILESLMEGLAEYYVADLRQKVKRGLRETALKGFVVTGYPPYSYKIVDKKYLFQFQYLRLFRKLYGTLFTLNL